MRTLQKRKRKLIVRVLQHQSREAKRVAEDFEIKNRAHYLVRTSAFIALE